MSMSRRVPRSERSRAAAGAECAWPSPGGTDDDPAHVLALDVSSTAAGWAVFREGLLDDFGLIRPPGRLPAIDRIGLIREGVEDVVGVEHCFVCALEWSGGKVHGRLGRVHGLAVLGQAQGVVYERLRSLGVPTWPVGEGEWTGKRPKAARAAEIRLRHPEYARWAEANKDAGGDVSDAIGLGEWAMARARVAAMVLLARANAEQKKGGRIMTIGAMMRKGGLLSTH